MRIDETFMLCILDYVENYKKYVAGNREHSGSDKELTDKSLLAAADQCISHIEIQANRGVASIGRTYPYSVLDKKPSKWSFLKG